MWSNANLRGTNTIDCYPEMFLIKTVIVTKRRKWLDQESLKIAQEVIQPALPPIFYSIYLAIGSAQGSGQPPSFLAINYCGGQ